MVRRERTEVETSARPFHQYEFSHRDWVRRVRDAGFEVVAVRSHLVGAGLGDIPFLSRPHGAAVCHAATDPPLAEAPVGGSGASGVRGGLGRLKRAAIDERGDNLMERLVARSAQGLVGHMVLTVARRPDRLV